jgi:YD repeat-containing protein
MRLTNYNAAGRIATHTNGRGQVLRYTYDVTGRPTALDLAGTDTRWLRLMVKRTSFLFASLLWLRWIPDLNSGLRVFRRECLLEWVHQLPDGFSCTSTATLAALSNRQRVEFVSIPYRSRTNGAASKFHPFFDTLKLWRAILKARARTSTT